MHSKQYAKSAESTFEVCRILNKLFLAQPHEKAKWLRNRMAMLFLRAIPQANNSLEIINEFGRFFPIRNAFTVRQQLKSFAYMLFPRLYCTSIKLIRGYKPAHTKGERL